MRGALLLIVLCAGCAQVSQTKSPPDLSLYGADFAANLPADLSSPSQPDLSSPPDLATAADLGPFVDGANYQISVKMDGQVMSLQQKMTANGTAVVQQPLANTADQRWSLHQLSPGLFEIINNSSQSCIDVTNQSLNDTAALVIWSCIGNTSQQWSFQDAGNGFYNIVNKNSGKVIDVPGGTTTPGAGLIQYSYNGGDNQKWLFTRLP